MKDSYPVAENPTRCQACGTLLNARLDGLCPSCTWQALVESAEQNRGPQIPPDGGAEPVLFRVANHIVIEEIDRGGMGLVYRARQIHPARMVALKMLLAHQVAASGMIDRFRLEIKALTQLDHPSILPVYDAGEYEGMPYFTMKLAAGGTLASRISQYRGRFADIANLLTVVAGAVQFAHERGVLHRDLKPGNVLFDESGRPYISDFGLAKMVDCLSDAAPSLTVSTHLLGTPQFLAPELILASAAMATTAADIYGLGGILYALMTGQPPFSAENLPALCRRIAEEEPVPPSKMAPDVPRDLEVICLKCLAKQPARRYASAREFADDLQRWLDGDPILARPVSQFERMVCWTRKNPALTFVTLLLITATLAGGAMLLSANHRLKTALKDAETAYASAQRNLYAALLVQSRLILGADDSSQRDHLLAVIKQTAAIKPDREVRNEAVAALAWPGESQNHVFVRFPAANDHRACTLDVTRDGRFLVTGTLNGVALLDTGSRTQIWSRPQLAMPWMYVACPPDGKSFLYSSRNFGIERCDFNCSDGNGTLAVQVADPIGIGRSIDTTIIGFTGMRTNWLVAADRTGLYISRIEVWPGGHPDQARIVARGEPMTFFSLSPDENWGASTTVPGTDVRLWDARQAKSIGFLRQTNAIITEFSPNGQWLIARMPEHYGVWDVGTWRLVKEWPVSFGGWNSSRIVFSHDSRVAAAPLGGNGFQLLNGRDLSELCLLRAPIGFEALAAVWSPDDSRLYLLDGGHRLYEWNITALRKELAALNLNWAD